MTFRDFVLRLLRVPLAWKIAGANALLTLALAGGFYLLPSAMAETSASLVLLIGGMLVAVAVNVSLVRIALKPIHDLEQTAQRVWSGASDVRVPRSLIADHQLRRVAQTVDGLMERLEADRARLKQLTSQLIKARSSERASLARELTESVAQSATALALECAALKASKGNGSRADQLDKIGSTAADLVDEVRRIARDIHPRHIHELGLESALRSLTRVIALDTSIDVQFTTHGIRATADALPYDVAVTLYDVAREALQNVHRHSAAKRVDVSLGIERHVARLSIVDDGHGFDTTVDSAEGFGLKLLRERAELVGGALEVGSRRGTGTQIVALIPLPHEAKVRSATSESKL